MALQQIVLFLVFSCIVSASAIYQGFGTVYTLTSPFNGNCNFMHTPDRAATKYAALNTEQWEETMNCGRCIEVSCTDPTCAGRPSEVVHILDQCPGCGYGGLDLSPEVFESITGQTYTILPIEWKFVDCPVSSNVEYCLKTGSTEFWVAVQPTNLVSGVTSMKINNQETSRVDSAFYFLIDGKGKSVANLSELTISVTGVNGEVLEDTLSMKADLCTAGSSQFSPSGDIDQTTTISVDSFSSTETSSTNSAQEIPTATPTNAPTETPPPEHSTDETVPYAVQNVSFEALTPTAPPTEAPTPAPVQDTPPPTSQETPTIPEYSTNESVPYAVQNISFEATTPTGPPTEAPSPAPSPAPVQEIPPPTSQETPNFSEHSTNESVPFAVQNVSFEATTPTAPPTEAPPTEAPSPAPVQEIPPPTSQETPTIPEYSTNESVPYAVQNVSFEATTPTAPPTEAPVQEIPPPTSQETLTPPEHSTNESVLFAVQNDSFEASTPTAPPTEAPTAPPTEAPTPAPVQEIPSTTTIEAPTVPKDSTNEPVSCAVQEAAFEAITPIIEAPTPKTVQQPLTNDPTKPFSDALVPENPTDTFSPVTDAPSATLAIGPSAFTPHISPLKEQSVSLQNRAVSIDHQSLQDQSTGPIKLAVVASTEPTLDAIDQNELEVETDNPSTTLKTQERTSSGPNLITSLPPVNEASVQNQTIASDGPWSTPAVIGVIVAACVVLGVVVAVAIALHKKRKLLEESKFDDRVSEDSLDAYFIDTNTPRSEAFLTHSVV